MRARHLLLLALVLGSAFVYASEDLGGRSDDVISDSASEASSFTDSEASSEEPEPEPAAPPPKREPPPPPPKKAAPVLSVESAEAQTLSASGRKQGSKSAEFGGKLLEGAALEGGATVEVTFTPKTDGAPSKPQQAMVMLVPAGSKDLAAYAVAKAKKDGSHTVVLSQALVEKQLGPLGGKFVATLLIGDPSAPKGLRWKLGTVQLPEGEGAKPAYRTARVQPVNNLLPNIAHMFRAPETRPPAVVSLAFAAAAVAPLALLVLWLLATGNLGLSAFPSGAGALWAVIFHGGLGSLLLLYWMFWTKLNLAQTLPLAAGLGAVTAAAGYKALSALADARLQQERAGGAGAQVAKKTN